ncbi:MAG: radical SAM protein [Bdellovibrionales bacterium]|nr:radical SAM protein [Bdellovibrionales bacterium]
MKLNQLQVSPIKEGVNLLKVLPSYFLDKPLARPVSVNFLITSRCNSKCVTCDSWKLDDHEGELTLEEFKVLARDIRELEIPIVTIGGGEPTIRKDIWDIIKIFKREGLNVQLTTNGLTLRDKQREAMYDSGLDRATVSVDSHIPSTYEAIRGVNGVKSVLDNLQTILSTQPAHFSVDTNTVLCRDNAETFLNTLDTLIEMGMPRVNFSAVTTFGENYLMTESKAHLSEIPLETIDTIISGLLSRKSKTHAISASKAFIKGLRKYYENPEKLVYPCYAGFLTLDIFQDGSVHGCGNLPKIANIRDASLKDIWTSTRAQQNRKNMANGKCPNCYLSCKMELAIASNPKHMIPFGIEKLLSGLIS